jgi:outer membrane lipoprotein carrier protein
VKPIALAALLAFAALAAGGQEAPDILTADQFFGQVAERYVQITDYEGRIAITTPKGSMKGSIAFKAPAFLRIDFIQPPDQVIVFNGEVLTVYIPEFRAILSQSTSDKPSSGGAALATREGLKMMKRNYSIAYELNPDPVGLDEGSTEMVVRLALSRKTLAEGFRTLRLSVSPDTKLIRRIEGWTLANERLVFDFTDMKQNQGIPDARFVYDSPASANVYNNFLFKSEN